MGRNPLFSSSHVGKHAVPARQKARAAKSFAAIADTDTLATWMKVATSEREDDEQVAVYINVWDAGRYIMQSSNVRNNSNGPRGCCGGQTSRPYLRQWLEFEAGLAG